MRILQDKYSHIEFSDMKLWSSNRGKHYCALKIHSKHKHGHSHEGHNHEHNERISQNDGTKYSQVTDSSTTKCKSHQ